jgi:hypothetical protein
MDYWVAGFLPALVLLGHIMREISNFLPDNTVCLQGRINLPLQNMKHET